METILLHNISTEDFLEKVRLMIREEIKSALQQDQLLTKEGALKVAGISNAIFLRAIQEGVVKPQLVKGRRKAMYLESEVLNIDRKNCGVNKFSNTVTAQSYHLALPV